MADAPTQATPASNNTTSASAAPAPATATPANSAPKTASPAGPGVTSAGGQPTTKPASAEQSAKSLTGGVDSDAVTNLVQSGIFKRMRAILGDTSAEVADKVVTTAKKLWNSFVENNVGPVKNMNEIIRRTIRFWTGGSLVRTPLKKARNFVGNRLKRVSNRYKKIKNELQSGGQSSAANLGGPGVTSPGSATTPPQQASSNKTSLSGVKSLRGAWRKATALRESLGIGHLPTAGMNAKTRRTARPTV